MNPARQLLFTGLRKIFHIAALLLSAYIGFQSSFCSLYARDFHGVNITADSAKPCKIYVTSSSEFKKTVPLLIPGDTLELASGTYDLGGNLNITKSGTIAQPIIIRAQKRGSTVFINKSCFDLKAVEYVIIEGFVFNSTDVTTIKTESCNNIRITRNTFRLKETTSTKWVLIGGTYNISEPKSHHNRIDHNLFEEKHQLGNCITIDGSPNPTAKSSQYDRIDHNYFRNVGPRAENEMETIRIGWSAMSMSSGYTTVEYNLFENCDGDPEIISVKTCDDTIRYNTILTSQGTVCLRHGNRSTVEGNFFLGKGKPGTGGVRVYGDDHRIFNNYFEGLAGDKWDAAITITNGDADYPSGSLSNHFRPRRGVFVFNTLVNNKSNIEIGYTNSGSYKKPPSDNTIANNIISGSAGHLINLITSPVNMSWSGNILFPADTSLAGISLDQKQLKFADPLLVQDNGLWRVSSLSPAVDSAFPDYDFVSYDMDGQKRDTLRDIGADEFYSSGQIFQRPLTLNDVGPDAEDALTDVKTSHVQIFPSEYKLNQNYPNPFNPSTIISYEIGRPGFVSLSIFDMIGRKVSELVDRFQNTGEYIFRLDAHNLSSGMYIYELKVNGKAQTKKMMLVR